jgi:hypothetical protein
MSVDGRLRNKFARDASNVDVDVDRFLGDVVTRGRRRRRLRRVGGAVVGLALIAVLAARGPALLDSIRHQREVPVGPGPSESTSAVDDPLVGIWQSTTTRAQLRKTANIRFPEARTAPWKSALKSFFRQNGKVGVNTMQFQDGVLSIQTSADGGIAQGEWNGAYRVVDDNTFVAGDHGNLYITFRFRITGNDLIVHVVKDRFPADIGRNPPRVPDLLPAVLLWETAPFIKVG